MIDVTHLYFVAQLFALSAVIVVSVCRLNMLRLAHRPGLCLTYIALSCGAFAMLYTTSAGDLYEALFASGVALMMIVDRRKSTCYDGECPV